VNGFVYQLNFTINKVFERKKNDDIRKTPKDENRQKKDLPMNFEIN
jgi:hypothetical protein